MKKENEFLINLLLSKHHPKSSQRVEYLAKKNLDWEYLCYQIIMHRIGGIVAESILNNHLLSFVPKNINTFLFDIYSNIQYKHLYYLNELKKLISDLEKHNIKYVIIKGIHLSTSIYKDYKFYPRDFSDLDILVLKESLDDVIQLLKENGYNHARLDYYTDTFKMVERHELLNGKMFYHQIPPFEKKFEPYFIGKNTYKVDVNYTIFEGGQHRDPISMTELLESGMTRDVANLQYRSLCPEDDLLQNCYHFYKDILYPPKNQRKDVYKIVNFYDIYLLLNTYKDTFNYTKLIERTKRSAKIEQALYIAINLTERFFGDLNFSNFTDQLNHEVPAYIKDLFYQDIETIVFENKRDSLYSNR